MLLESYQQKESLRANGTSNGASNGTGSVNAESHHTEELAALAIAGASIVSNLDVDKVLKIIAQQITNLIDVPICILADWRADNGGIKAHTKFGNSRVSRLPRGYKLISLTEQLGLMEVVEKSRPLQITEDQQGLSKEKRQALKRANVFTLLTLPLVAQNKAIGLVELQETRGPRIFNEREIYLAQTLCHQAAAAIENARLFQATGRQVGEMSILYQVATAGTEATSEDELIERATKLIKKNLYQDNFGVLMLDRSANALRIHPSYEGKLTTTEVNIPLGSGVSGSVAVSGQPLRVGNVQAAESYLAYDKRTQSELCVPMKIGERVIGVINAESKDRDHFSEDDERLLLTLAGQLASGIERLRNAAAEERRAKQLSILNKLTGEMSGVLERDRLFKIVVQRLNREMNYTSTDISLVNEDTQEYVTTAVSGTFESLIPEAGYRQPFGVGLLARAADSGKVVVANDIRQHPDYILVDGHESIKSELIIPIKIYKRVVALLNIESTQLNAFDEHEVGALTTLCDQISIALEGINLFDSTRRQLQELTVLHAITHAAVNAKSEEDLLERATEIIGDSVYPDQFGFLMLDEDGENLLVNANYRGVSDKVKKKPVPVTLGVAGKVALSGKPWRIANVLTEPNYHKVSSDMMSELCVPIVGNNARILGVINAESAQLDAFSEKDLRLLNTIAGQLGTAIEKLRLFESERQQREQAETLREVAAILASETDSSKVLDLILEQLKRVVPFDSASIQILNGEKLIVGAFAGPEEQNAKGYELLVKDDQIAHPILFEHRTMVYEDVNAFDGWLKIPTARNVRSWIGTPLIVRGTCIGVLTVDSYQVNHFSGVDAQLVSVFASHAAIALENARLFEDAQEAYVQTVSALASAIDVRDSYTSGHSERLAELAVKTGEILGCSDEQLVDIQWGGLLHDIGKIGVPDDILRKPEALTPEEENIMRRHPEIGAHIVSGVRNLASVAPIIRAHQERFDGKGYPDQLKGEEIPLIARIISVADAYVAMTDDRVYRKSMDRENAIKELKRCSGSQFDPKVVNAFLKAIDTLD